MRWFLESWCLDCLLNRLFRPSSWIYLNLKQLQNYVHEYLFQGNSSLFKLMAWQWTDAKPFPAQYHFTYAHLSPGFTICYHDKNSLCNQNNRSYEQLSPRQPSVAVTVTVFYTWQYRLPLPSWCANVFSLTTLWEGSSVTGSSPHKEQVMQSVYIFIVVILNKLLNKQRNAYESSWNLLNI